jgi:hypothetical protein
LNANEGLIRIAKAIRYFGYLLALAFFIGAISSSSDFWFIFIAGAVLGILFYTLAWIIDGFASKR